MKAKANELRAVLINSQRMQKTKDKWQDFADNLHEDFTCKSENKGYKIGDKIDFTVTKRFGHSVNISFCAGIVFALGNNRVLIMYRGKLYGRNYPEKDNS